MGRAKESAERKAFERIAKEAEEQIVSREKKKYAEIREKMLCEMQEKEEALRLRHKGIMSRLIKERKRQIVNIGQSAKQTVHQRAMSDLETEYDRKQREMEALQHSFNEKQNEIKNLID